MPRLTETWRKGGMKPLQESKHRLWYLLHSAEEFNGGVSHLYTEGRQVEISVHLS